MKRALYLILFLGYRVFSQDLDITLDTAVIPASQIRLNQYTMRSSKQSGGEGWEIKKDKTLHHIFYSDVPNTAFTQVGEWASKNDSILFYIKTKNLIKKYGHSSIEMFKPFNISLNFRSNTKDPSDSTKVMVYRNKIIILNTGQSARTLFEEIKAHLNSRLEPVKNKLDPTLKWYYTELNDNLKIELGDFLFQKKLYSSITTSRNFE